MKNSTSFLVICCCLGFLGCDKSADTVSDTLEKQDDYTIADAHNFLSDFEPRNADGSVNVVVEIPAGTNAKWEVAKPDGHLKWEIRDGKPRIVKYLPYPGNYGMVPRTLLPKELGGDGDPLDVIVLGPAVERGAVVKANLVGVLKLLDGGEQDDKLLAVEAGSPLDSAGDLSELEAQFPGVLAIIETWFSNYKGPGQLESQGFGDVTRAGEILMAAISAYNQMADSKNLKAPANPSLVE